MKRSVLRFIVLAVLVSISFPACVLPNFTAFLQEGKDEVVTVAADQLTLMWDAPASTIDHYTVFFRVHGMSDWVTLANVPADPLPEYTVAHATVGDGEFDFAVVAVDSADHWSSYHTSLDATAQPEGGWYVSWFVQ